MKWWLQKNIFIYYLKLLKVSNINNSVINNFEEVKIRMDNAKLALSKKVLKRARI